VVTRAIKERAPQVKVEAHDKPAENEDEIRALVEDADFVICCVNAGQSDLILKLNRVCLAAGIRWTSCALSGAEIILGPTVHPFDGPCYLCYRMRVVACSRNPEDALAHKRYLDQRQQDDTGTRENLVFGVGMAANLVGLEALKELTTFAEPSATGRIVIFNLLDLTSSTHVLLRKPWCTACFREQQEYKFSERTKRLRFGRPDSPNNRMLELVSDRTGIIKELSCVTRGIEEPDPPVIYQATLSHLDLRKSDAFYPAACGKGKTTGEAIAGAIGEAVELYCASYFDARRIRVATWPAVEREAIAPPEFVLYSPKQYARMDFPYQRWNPEEEIRWVAARELPGDSMVLVPASLIYLSGLGLGVQDYFCPATSNGLAAGLSCEAAVLHGLYELIERDGFLIHWMNRLPGPEVECPAEDALAYSILSHYRRYGVEVRVFNLSTDLPAYVMMSVAVETSGGGPATVIGLGCHLDPRVALLKSLLEICQAHPGERLRYREEPPAERLKRYEDVRSMCDHSAFLTIPERLNEFDFLFEHGRGQKIEDLPNKSRGSVDVDLDECVNSMSHQGYRVCCVEISTPDVIGCGLHVIRVLATGLQPLHFGFGKERLGGRRLFEVPQQLGLAASVRAESDLNPCPHPLA
jgi:ribosomal protein S12 methylthiotransferase accessory factor